MAQSDRELLEAFRDARAGLTWNQVESLGIAQTTADSWIRQLEEGAAVNLRPGSRQKIEAFLRAREGGQGRVLEIAREMERLAAELRALTAPDEAAATRQVADAGLATGGASEGKGLGRKRKKRA